MNRRGPTRPTDKELFDGTYASLTLTESRPIGSDGIFLHVYRPRA
jgi:hypothetical protein